MKPSEKEKLLIELYKTHLKEILPVSGEKPRAISVPVEYPLKDRTLYHLVYLTRHAKGIAVFMEASEKLQLVQRKVRAQVKQDKRQKNSGQIEMFSDVAAIKDTSETDIRVVEQYWLENLSTTPQYFGLDMLADMLEETGWFETDLQRAFGNLQHAGKVRNLDDHTQRRRTKFVHFQENHNQGERLIKVEL